MERWWRRMEMRLWREGVGDGRRRRRGGVAMQRIFCFPSNSVPFSSPVPSVRRAESQSHLGLDGKHTMTAAVSQTNMSLSHRRNRDDEEDAQMISNTLDQMTTLEALTYSQGCQTSRVVLAAFGISASFMSLMEWVRGQFFLIAFHKCHPKLNQDSSSRWTCKYKCCGTTRRAAGSKVSYADEHKGWIQRHWRQGGSQGR